MSPHCAPEHSFPRGKRIPVGLTCCWWLTWLPTARSTSALLFPSTLPHSCWFPSSFDPIDLPQPKLLGARLSLFIWAVNLQHGVDPLSWQWSGNKLQRLNEKNGNCVSIALLQGKWAYLAKAIMRQGKFLEHGNYDVKLIHSIVSEVNNNSEPSCQNN